MSRARPFYIRAVVLGSDRASVFYDDPETGRSLVRFAFCKKLEVIEEAVQRLLSLRDR
jgi:aspartate/methionine/tyrosine aminotransferase